MSTRRDSILSKPKWFLSGAAIGSALAFYLDPDRGRARRAQMRDRLVRLNHEASRWSNLQAQHARHHAQGWLARAQAALSQESVDDETLYQRVRSEMGRKVKQASAIEVDVHAGHITLKGEVDASEIHRLVSHIRRVRGVRHVNNLLQVRERKEDAAKDARVYM